MPKSFSSFGASGVFLSQIPQRLATTRAEALDKIGRDALQRAQGKPGSYQEAAGPFPGWSPLAASTMIERRILGFTPNDPLLRTGELRDSYLYAVSGPTVSIGSPLTKAADMENGVPANNVPARPVVGPAMWEGGIVQGQLLLAAVADAFTKG